MPVETEDVVARLKRQAEQTSKIHREMAEAKSLRQEGNPEGRTDLYMWPTPEQTIEGRAADLIQSLSERIDVLEGLLVDAREALALGAAIPPVDYKNRGAVISLGEQIGYGALMATASVEWRSRLGDLAGSEFCSGPCRSTAENVIERIDASLTEGIAPNVRDAETKGTR